MEKQDGKQGLYSWKLCWFEFKPVVIQQTRIKNHWKMFFCHNYCVQWLCALRLYSWGKWFDKSHLLKIRLKSVIGQRVSKMGKISLSPHKSITSNAPNCKFSFLEQDKWVRICYNSGMNWKNLIVFAQIWEETGQLELVWFRNELNS